MYSDDTGLTLDQDDKSYFRLANISIDPDGNYQPPSTDILRHGRD